MHDKAATVPPLPVWARYRDTSRHYRATADGTLGDYVTADRGTIADRLRVTDARGGSHTLGDLSRSRDAY